MSSLLRYSDAKKSELLLYYYTIHRTQQRRLSRRTIIERYRIVIRTATVV